MNNEDMSDVIQKITSMMNNTNNQENNNTENDVSSNSNNINPEQITDMINTIKSQSSNNDNNANNNLNFDINTILKMKNIIDKVNSNQNDPRANLLLSLKPYLNNNRKQKLDEYMQFLNISKIIEAFNSDNGVGKK